jgi:2,4-dienoyl-CoA reductase-like NADH-dependent reductase (Old Yellow Enzyme family)
MSSIAPLFKPFRVHNLTLPNRVVMSPMTRSHSPGGVPGENVAAYYRRRAEGGVGLIVTEGVAINHPAAVSDDKIPQMFGDAALAGWKRVTSEVHAVGGIIFPQLWHVGMMRKPGELPNIDAPAVGPSGLALNGKQIAAPLTEQEVEYLIGAYAEAAGNAMKVGFDGIELHGAHGYLIDQFFWGQTNKRTDRFGGDIAARTRFCVEIVQACRRATSPDFPIVLRFSQWKSNDYTAKLVGTPQELEQFVKPLVDAGVDIFHCSQRRFWETEFDSALNLAGWTKKLSGKPVVTVGSVGLDSDLLGSLAGKGAQHMEIDKVVAMVERGEVDLVAVGRALLADAAWPTKIREGRAKELTPLTTESFMNLI